jgi:hypothetical protein
MEIKKIKVNKGGTFNGLKNFKKFGIIKLNIPLKKYLTAFFVYSSS